MVVLPSWASFSRKSTFFHGLHVLRCFVKFYRQYYQLNYNKVCLRLQNYSLGCPRAFILWKTNIQNNFLIQCIPIRKLMLSRRSLIFHENQQKTMLFKHTFDDFQILWVKCHWVFDENVCKNTFWTCSKSAR